MKWAREFSSQPLPFLDGNIASVWGGARARIYKLFPPRFRQLHYRDAELKSPLGLGAIVRHEKNGKKVAKKPLVVIFPGIFNNIRDGMPLRALDRFAAFDAHVLLLPNPWGTDFISSGFKYSPGDVVHEARLMKRAIDAFIRWIGAENVTTVDWSGESYGGFLATVALALDAERPGPRPATRVTLFGPPTHFERAIERVDALIGSTREKYFEHCSGSFNLVRFVLDFMRSPLEASLGNRTRECSDALLAFTGFQENLIASAKALDRVRKLGKIPTNRKERKAWERNLGFMDFFRDFAPDAMSGLHDSPKADLGYWLSLTRELRGLGFPIRVLSADDDFLNDRGDWSKNSYFDFTEQLLILLPWGGHVGYAATDDYEKMLHLAFPGR